MTSPTLSAQSGTTNATHAAGRDAQGFLDLSDYVSIGDGRTVALIGTDGRIDWLPLPHLDSTPVFAALLDPEDGGWIGLEPSVPYTVERHYLEQTNALVTTYTTQQGSAQLPAADITDMYVFPAPDRPGFLVLVLDTVPYADPHGFFSPDLVYRFRLRPLTVDRDSPALFDPAPDEDEVTVDCTFSAPTASTQEEGSTQQGRCVVSRGSGVTHSVPFGVSFGDEVPAGTDDEAVRVFAGPRWDPFFSDAIALEKTISTGRLAFSNDGKILSDGKNVLSVVVQLDCAAVLGDATLLAVVGETVIAGPIPVRWERFGRPEMENSVLGMKTYDTVNRDLEIRDLFNAEDAFRLSDDYLGAYRARLDANLVFWDDLDGKTDWTPDDDGSHPLRELMLADFLVVDVSKPFGDDTFLEIEQALLAGDDPQTSGGRSPDNDSMDTLYTLLVNGGHGPRISDHVDWATKPATRTFPYLNPANPHPPAPPHSH